MDLGPLPSNKLPSLVVPKSRARGKIIAQIEKGRQVRSRRIANEDDLEKARAERDRWSKFNIELLNRFFDGNSIAKEYEGSGFVVAVSRSFGEEVQDFRRDVDRSIERLESIRERLKLIPAAGERPSSVPGDRSRGKEVLIVHGHDEGARESLLRFIEKSGLNPIVLHELPDKGRTIIEKLEDHTNVSYAIVLLTPDDAGAPEDKAEKKEEWKGRARQNVVFELGMLVGKLGRSRVCVLRKGGVEIPSDYHGVIYEDMDSGGGWRLELAKEIRAAGIDIDLNRYVF